MGHDRRGGDGISDQHATARKRREPKRGSGPRRIMKGTR